VADCEQKVISKNKIFVTYEASGFSIEPKRDISPPNVVEKYNIKDNYVLSVASLLPHKNLHKLVEAFALLKGRIEHQLVLVGLKGHALDKTKRAIQDSFNHPDRVAFLGYVPRPDLAGLYRKASLFVLPSLFEGFGIPLLEAMSLGCPVAASNRTSIPEVVGDAAVLFNPDNSEQIAEAIFSVVSDKTGRERLVNRGRQRVKLFSWERMAGETIDAYSVAY